MAEAERILRIGGASAGADLMKLLREMLYRYIQNSSKFPLDNELFTQFHTNRKRLSKNEGLLFYDTMAKKIIPEPEREHSCAGGM